MNDRTNKFANERTNEQNVIERTYKKYLYIKNIIKAHFITGCPFLCTHNIDGFKVANSGLTLPQFALTFVALRAHPLSASSFNPYE